MRAFWLHVDDAGREHRYDERPANVPTICVNVSGNFEETLTRVVVGREYDEETIRVTVPSGADWREVDRDDYHAIWRRPARS